MSAVFEDAKGDEGTQNIQDRLDPFIFVPQPSDDRQMKGQLNKDCQQNDQDTAEAV